jgi:transcriptional regulatory protein LevR
MDLSIRLNILKDSGQITENTYNAINEVILLLKEKRGIILTEENGAMFITHLSSALTRIEKSDLVGKIEDSILEEIKKDTNYEKTLEIVKEVEGVTGKFPTEERDFIEMHICTLLSN